MTIVINSKCYQLQTRTAVEMNDVSNLLQQVKRALKYYLEMCIADRQEAWGRITRLMSYVSEGGEK